MPSEYFRGEGIVQTRFDLGQALVRLRKMRGLTQQQLAARTGLRQNVISRAEHGTTNPRFETLLAMTAGLDAQFTLVPNEDAASVPPALRPSETPSAGAGSLPRSGVSGLVVRERD
jgi:HTH-type transcriptional regulator/antitoxin HipB